MADMDRGRKGGKKTARERREERERERDKDGTSKKRTSTYQSGQGDQDEKVL